MKTKTQTTDQKLALHDLRQLRQRLGATPDTAEQARTPGDVAFETTNELGSANGFLVS